MINGRTPETSLSVIRHPLLKAGAFTGSLVSQLAGNGWQLPSDRRRC